MSKYYVVSSDILPDVLEKVIEARNLLQSGKVKRISEAVKAVGVSRGTYYKYKDAVFSFNDFFVIIYANNTVVNIDITIDNTAHVQLIENGKLGISYKVP